jgi:hypothetical protein
VRKYGYLNLALSRDSSFEFHLAVLKDVKLERSVFGIEGQVTLLKAVFESTKFGRFRGGDSEITLYSRNDSIFVRPRADTSSLSLRFADRNRRTWLCSLIPEDQ